MQVPPTRTILAGVLPNFPTVTSLMILIIEIVPNQKPVMISEKSWQPRNPCSQKLNFGQLFLPLQGATKELYFGRYF